MTDERPPTLTFRAGGWVLALAALLCVGVMVWALLGVFAGRRPRGDGQDPATYGFDLSDLRLDGRALVASGNPRGFLPPLDDPATLPATEVAATNEKERIKHVVGGDRVIGVIIDGEARAYPLPIMNAHEVCNDTLGGVPIAVTYGPLCDSVVVFDRRIERGGVVGAPAAASSPHVARFAASGLLLDSNLVMEDLDEPGTELDEVRSLWSQLAARAISGRAAKENLALRMIPGVQLVTWSQWRARYPQTTVIRRDSASIRRMKQFDYSRYWDGGELMFPVKSVGGAVARAPGARPMVGGVSLMMPTIAVLRGDDRAMLRLDEFAGKIETSATRALGDDVVSFDVDITTEAIWVDAPPDAVILHMRWFAWWAFFEPPPATSNQ